MKNIRSFPKKNILLILIGILFTVLLLNNTFMVKGADAPSATRVLYLVGDPNFESTYTDQPIKSLNLDKVNIEFNITNTSVDIDFSTQTDFDVIILNDYNLTVTEITQINDWLQIKGHGLIIIMGPKLTSGNIILDNLGIAPGIFDFEENELEQFPYETTPHSKPAISEVNESAISPIIQGIAWKSAPEHVNYTQLPNLDSISGNNEYIYMKYYNGTESKNSLVIGRSLCGTYDNVIVCAGWYLDEINIEFQLWSYFNYFIFSMVQSTAEKAIISYKDWKYSPVPHLIDQTIIGMIVLGLTIATILLYKKQRTKGAEKRNLFETIEKIEIELKDKDIDVKTYLENKDKLEVIERKVLDNILRKEENIAPIISPDKEVLSIKDEWEEIGFHRQQAGFLQTFFLLMFLIIPQLIITSFVFPMWIQPHPQAGGYYSYTLHFFEAIWLLFDMGLNFSFVKYFAANRIEHPEKAYHYVQIFVWWEIISGLGQIFMIAFMGSIIFPLTNIAYLSWLFIAHSLIQFPGFFQVFQYFFQGMQRSDKQMITFVLQMFLLRLVCQVVTVPIFRAIYSNIPVFGDAFGSGMGLIIGQYMGDIIMFIITIKWYKELKLGFSPIFSAEFTKNEFIESIKFGAKMVAGNVWVPAVWLLQVLLLSTNLPNYAAEQGYFELAWTITTIPAAATLIYEGVLGGLTEAWTYDKKNLLNYTSGASMRLGFFWTSFLCAALWAIGPTFILGTAGAGWARAADLVPLLVLFQLIGPFSWQADKEFAASDHPGYAGIAWILEQGIRATLLIILVPTMKIMESVLIAYIVSLAIKDIFVWLLIELKVHKHTWNIWTTFISPALSGISVYFVLKLMDIVFGGMGLIGVLLLFVMTFFLIIFLYSFFNGFFGGYDDNTINEFEKSANMVKGVGLLARTLYKSAKLGSKISPLHNKFPIKIYEEAYKEADELTAIKKKIVV